MIFGLSVWTAGCDRILTVSNPAIWPLAVPHSGQSKTPLEQTSHEKMMVIHGMRRRDQVGKRCHSPRPWSYISAQMAPIVRRLYSHLCDAERGIHSIGVPVCLPRSPWGCAHARNGPEGCAPAVQSHLWQSAIFSRGCIGCCVWFKQNVTFKIVLWRWARGWDVLGCAYDTSHCMSETLGLFL